MRHSLGFTTGWLVMALGLWPGEADAQWRISMRAMRNPLPLGECTPVEIVVRDAQGRQSPLRPDGQQVSGWDFDFTVTSSAPDAFRLENDDATRPFVCARVPSAPSATFTAHYPGRQLKPNQTVRGVELVQSIEIAMETGIPPTGYAQSDPTQGSGAPPGAYPGGAGYPAGNGATVGSPPSGGYAQGNPYPQGNAYPPGGAYPQSPGYPDPSQQPQQPQQAQPEPGAGAQGSQDTGVLSAKGFLQRITGHAKRKASEVAVNTTTGVADATGEVIGNTLETGGQVVKSGAGAVTGAAGKEIRGVGKALGARQDPGDPRDIAGALAHGRAVLRGLRFTEGTAILEPSSGTLISQIAGALARTPGQFLIEGHVDGKPSPVSQALSEQRAAAVKAALVAAGSSPMQLAAVGYGATRPMAGAKSSARIEIARTN